MAEVPSFIADPVVPAHAKSPLAGHMERGEFGALHDSGPQVKLGERFGLSIAEVAAWRGTESKLRTMIKSATGLTLKADPGFGAYREAVAAFNIGPGRFLVSGTAQALVAELDAAIGENGSVTDLSHGRTVIRIDGPKSRWVLAKLFAIDFADSAFAPGYGLATAHHDIFAQIQRVAPDAFDVYVFRSFARSFWHALCRAAAEVGYRVD